MVLGWGRRSNKTRKPKLELVIPNHFICPVSLDLIKDPVTLSTGITYDRESIERWFEQGNFTCPVTNQILSSFDLVPNHSLRVMIQDWCVENRRFGIERIPTPRIPVTPIQVEEILFQLVASASRLDRYGFLQGVDRIKEWGSESERNRRCIVDNGTPSVLASAFREFANDSIEENVSVLEEILNALNWMLPLQLEAQKILQSSDALRCLVWFFGHQDLSGKQNAIVALRQILSSGDKHTFETMAEIEGTIEPLVEFINKRINPTITKASLGIVYYLVSSSYPSSEKVKLEFIELGLISSLLEILIDADKSLSEKALGVFDSLCDCQRGREKAFSNALTVPVLVKKILRISALATNYSVSALWKLCRYGSKDDDEDEVEGALIEALQVGAFQKLLVVLQVGCGDETKEKATELLKLFNPYRAGLECIDSDFKNLKRSF
ncbi:U-box domain-containing protein 21-like [Prosopis cineraria]|uniref:U-box domain-containing protein 21-like n=1 Tax=Prosopis cineraria TaxID=364024 RepID=UPI002410A482|nr:U-box domain-containing protein 21-like [Prosopis cineraria]